MTITEFLLARIAEDEAAQWDLAQLDRPRVLAECEAKRRIVVQLMEASREGSSDYELGYGLHFAARALAAVYADHPDYDQAWSL